MNEQQRRAKRAQAYDQRERASDHGWRKRAPPVTGNAARMRRLRKDYPELHKLVLAGELTVCQAAIAAGFRPNHRGSKKPDAKPKGEPNITPLQEMDLWLGPSHHGSTFASEEERRRLWVENRDRLMRLFGQDGCRPMAWWRYESPVPFPGLNLQRSTLYEHGLLGEAEARALVADWRTEFVRACEPDFAYVAGPGEIYQGATARQRHFTWADIPSALVEQWQAARQTNRSKRSSAKGP
jgi:hypothetical protein